MEGIVIKGWYGDFYIERKLEVRIVIENYKK